MGYKFQSVTLAGFHSLNHGMYELTRGKAEGMATYPRFAADSGGRVTAAI